MKKIMFNDKYRLTEAVLSGRKTQTRRIVPQSVIDKYFMLEDPTIIDDAKYEVGDVVAIAQSYASIVEELENPKNYYCMEHWEADAPKRAHYAGLLYHPGNTNKMFVSAYEMPHRIRITNVNIERLQDISDEDCIKEGLVYDPNSAFDLYGVRYGIGMICLGNTPREAYAALIDKISGKGTWNRNPDVFAYEFELIK